MHQSFGTRVGVLSHFIYFQTLKQPFFCSAYSQSYSSDSKMDFVYWDRIFESIRNWKFPCLKKFYSLSIKLVILKTFLFCSWHLQLRLSNLPALNQPFLPIAVGDFLQNAPFENLRKRVKTTSKISSWENGIFLNKVLVLGGRLVHSLEEDSTC